jgi:CubicO group peptidase (beta-lactamase class C family)
MIEYAAGQPIDKAIKQRVLEPLGVSNARSALTPADIVDVQMGMAREFHPGWLYHGLLVGSLCEAALLLDRLFSGTLLPSNLLAEMQRAKPVDAVVLDRPWRAPSYGLGLMIEGIDGPVGHTGGGPDSSIAVYRSRHTAMPQTAAAFMAHGKLGEVETFAWAKL